MVDSLDTNLIVLFILKEPATQADKVWDLLSEAGERHHVADLAITEAVYVFEKHYGLTRVDIKHNLELFFRQFDDVLEYNRELFELALPYYVKHPALSFNDCCMAFYAELTHAELLFTFDKGLAKGHPSAKLL